MKVFKKLEATSLTRVGVSDSISVLTEELIEIMDSNTVAWEEMAQQSATKKSPC
jgi:hypothetical protein